jgi:YQGE family putative transporter
MQMLVIDTVSEIEKRNQYAYIFNQEFGYYIGRASGCIMFILLAFYVSDTFALRYALLIVALLQLFSAWIARDILAECAVKTPA